MTKYLCYTLGGMFCIVAGTLYFAGIKQPTEAGLLLAGISFFALGATLGKFDRKNS